jgi:hypothetical protein
VARVNVGVARYVAAQVGGYVSDQAGQGRMFKSGGWLGGGQAANQLTPFDLKCNAELTR